MNNQTTDEETQLLAQVPTDGTAIGNVALKKEIGWGDEKYWEIRNRLIDKKRLMLGRGRGGSVRRVIDPIDAITIAAQPGPELGPEKRENDLYQPIAKVLAEKWAKDLLLEEFFIQVTAKQGRRETGGTWTRPDVVAVYVSTYQYVPGKFVDVTTFEVKDDTNLSVTASQATNSISRFQTG